MGVDEGNLQVKDVDTCNTVKLFKIYFSTVYCLQVAIMVFLIHIYIF